MADQEAKNGVYDYYEYKGVSFCGKAQHRVKLEACINYNEVKDEDLYLFTFPKAGTHFVGDVVASIYQETGKTTDRTKDKKSWTALEIGVRMENPEDPTSHVSAANSPRVIGTHLPWSLLPAPARDGRAKVIHCIRNPKDVICSFYPFLKKMGCTPTDYPWDDFITTFIDGVNMYGDYFKFMQDWYPHRNEPHVLNIHFEDMKTDLPASVKSIAEFLNISLTDEQLSRIVEANTFSNRVKDTAPIVGAILRKGQKGGWKSEMTVAQNERLDAWIENGMKGMDDLTIHYE